MTKPNATRAEVSFDRLVGERRSLRTAKVEQRAGGESEDKVQEARRDSK